jgi:hypothetical protein
MAACTPVYKPRPKEKAAASENILRIILSTYTD